MLANKLENLCEILLDTTETQAYRQRMAEQAEGALVVLDELGPYIALAPDVIAQVKRLERILNKNY